MKKTALLLTAAAALLATSVAAQETIAPGANVSSPVLGLHLCAGDPQQSERRARAYVSGWRELDGEAW